MSKAATNKAVTLDDVTAWDSTKLGDHADIDGRIDGQWVTIATIYPGGIFRADVIADFIIQAIKGRVNKN